MPHLLFSYGTLQLPAVQVATFGREVTGVTDSIVGYRVEETRIEDPRVVQISGAEIHPVLVPAHQLLECARIAVGMGPQQLRVGALRVHHPPEPSGRVLGRMISA